jgi:t-SNARE complex subunit (syntaxin)
LSLHLQELTDAQAQSVVSRGLTEQVFQAVLLQDASSSAMQDIVAEVEDRHGQVLFLGQQVQEVYELMRDLALLIEAQVHRRCTS